MRARLTEDSSTGAIVLQTPYDANFIADLKSHIPYGGRAWDPQRKVWVIQALYEQDLFTLLAGWNAQIDDARIPGQQATMPGTADAMPPDLVAAFATLYLAHHAPLIVAEAVYKFLAQKLHPDKGGDAHAFSAIAGAIDTIRKYVKAPSA